MIAPLVRLTLTNGKPIYVNPAFVTLVESKQHQSKPATAVHVFAWTSNVLQSVDCHFVKGSVTLVANRLRKTTSPQPSTL